ncbi:MAG: hypothetical protein WBY78_18345 [Terriglobales bacterium]|jgi:hypothetical protein
MSKKANKNTATAQNGKSVQTEAVPMQPQQPIAPNGNSSETASGVAGVEATSANPQSIDAAPDQTEDHLPDPTEQDGQVLTLATLSQVRQGDIDAMSFKELDDFVDRGVQCIAFHHADVIKARKAMLPAIWRVHDALSCQGRRTDLLDAPADLTFDAWVRNKACLGSRATIYRLLADGDIPQQKQFAKGTKVKVEGKVDVGVVTRVHEVDGGVPKVDVLFEGEKKAETCVAESLVRVTVRKIAVGDRLVFKDKNGVEYRYEGDGKIVLTAGFLEGAKTEDLEDDDSSTSEGDGSAPAEQYL